MEESDSRNGAIGPALESAGLGKADLAFVARAILGARERLGIEDSVSLS
jgi:hypothetical protein